MSHSTLVILHLLGAAVWTGGHIVLCLAVLPKVLKERSPERLLDFESSYEKIGMPALLTQVVTGFMLAYHWLPDPSLWFQSGNPIAQGIQYKLAFLGLTMALALDARFRVIPKLSQHNLWDMAWHIIAVTVLSVGFLIAGAAFRLGLWL
ncbi:CopD family protein [Pseudoteredinibacter isoporae]|uniref:Putative copper export protein n=1 Tax=Pseudoteredinibacter isoporae TaxID=570281 RepID=A0A7X0MXK9_9GAMM|nr:CopD family protein [Pseudoteredinibacter isoporae]MBB6521057.1 putative copper export protein [Pseudoteredinibacter isoporae]NHO86621.1 copper resistance protein CopD [Pseudoteredinibacter isoporae]NIB24927.1 copper resistance protein CopD [Pseudoteredinibacter isoporae]